MQLIQDVRKDSRVNMKIFGLSNWVNSPGESLRQKISLHPTLCCVPGERESKLRQVWRGSQERKYVPSSTRKQENIFHKEPCMHRAVTTEKGNWVGLGERWEETHLPLEQAGPVLPDVSVWETVGDLGILCIWKQSNLQGPDDWASWQEGGKQKWKGAP